MQEVKINSNYRIKILMIRILLNFCVVMWEYFGLQCMLAPIVCFTLLKRVCNQCVTGSQSTQSEFLVFFALHLLQSNPVISIKLSEQVGGIFHFVQVRCPLT